MNHAQWIFEARGLRAKEERQTDFAMQVYSASVRALREVLVAVLGLKLGADRKLPTDPADMPDPFTPFVFFASRPETLQKMIEREEAADLLVQKTEDQYEEFADALFNFSEGDLEPLLKGKPKEFDLEEHKRLMKQLGVTVIDDG